MRRYSVDDKTDKQVIRYLKYLSNLKKCIININIDGKLDNTLYEIKEEIKKICQDKFQSTI